MRKLFVLGMAVAAGMTFAASSAMAVDIPVTPLKLIIVDKLVASSSAKAVFVVKDAAVSKGTGTNVAAMPGQYLWLFWWGAIGGAGMFALTPFAKRLMGGVK